MTLPDGRVGVSEFETPTSGFTIRVLKDGNGDTVADENAPHPDDPIRCGDDDSLSSDDGPATTDTREGGCGCRAAGHPSWTALGIAILLLIRRCRQRRCQPASRQA